MFIDSHCHLDRLKLDPYNGNLSEAIQAAHANAVDLMLCVAIDLEHIDQVLNIAKTYEQVYASVGVHPGSTDCEEPTVDHKELQLERFQRHLEVSKISRKPVIVHTRDAKEDTLNCINKYSDPSVGGVLHCFTEDLDMAQKAIDQNFYISFSGIVTFKNALELQAVAKALPLERILIETDSPYLAPVPFRGKPNEPKYVPHVAKFLAELKGVSLEKIAEQTSENFKKLFFLNYSEN